MNFAVNRLPWRVPGGAVGNGADDSFIAVAVARCLTLLPQGNAVIWGLAEAPGT